MRKLLFILALLSPALVQAVVVACDGYTGVGNWEIQAGQKCANVSETIYLTGNLTIYGSLNLTNVTIIANGTYNGSIHIDLKAGGSLKLNDTDGNPATTNDATNVSSNNSAIRLRISAAGSLIITNSIIRDVGHNGPFDHYGLNIADTVYANVTNTSFSHMWLGLFVIHSNFSNFSYNNFTSTDSDSFYLYGSSNNTLEGNNVFNSRGSCITITNYLTDVAADNNVTNNNASYCSYTGIAVHGPRNTLVNNTLQGSSTSGISVYSNAYNATLTNNNVSGGTYGILITDSDNATVQNSTITGTTYIGIYASNSSFSRYRYNNASYNTRYGLLVMQSNNATIQFNNMRNNTPNIYLWYVNSTTIANNTLGIATGSIDLYGSSNNTIQNNTITNATNSGYLWGNGIVLSDGSNYNDFSYNTVTNSTYAGIYDSDSTNNTYFANDISDSYENGIIILDSNFTNILNNTIDANVPLTNAIQFDGYNHAINNNTITKTNSALAITLASVMLPAELASSRVYSNNTINGKPVLYFGISEYACPDNANVIIGNSNASAVAIIGCSNVTIKDGTITNGDGIAVYYANNSRVTNATINFSYVGTLVFNGENTTVANNTLYNNTFGVYSTVSTNTTIQNNTLTNSTTSNAYLNADLASTIYNNTVTGGASDGITIDGSGACNASYNLVTNNVNGININNGAAANRVQENNASYNTQTGINLDLTTTNILTGNNVSFNANGYAITNALSSNVSDDRIYNNTFGVLLNTSAGNNNFTSTVFDNNTYHVQFNGTTNNYIINSTFGAYLTNQTLSNNSAYDYLVNNTAVNTSALQFADASSNLTLAYTVNVDVTSSSTGAAIAAAVGTVSQGGATLFSGTSPVRNAIMPVYLARSAAPLNYTPHLFGASFAGYSSNNVAVAIYRDTNVSIALSPTGGALSTPTPSPSPATGGGGGGGGGAATSTPTPTITPTPTPEPSVEPAKSPTPKPTVAPTARPTAQTPTPTATPSTTPVQQTNYAVIAVIVLVILGGLYYLSAQRKAGA